MQLPPQRQADLDAVVADVIAAYRSFSASLTDAQRQCMGFPLDGKQRTTSRDGQPWTPAFGAVLAWCVPGWGLELGPLSYPQRMAFEEFLRTAMGSTGYAVAAAVRNRQNLIGMLENSANTEAIEAAAKDLPNQTFADLRGLLAALAAKGATLPPEASAVAIGGLNPGKEDWVWKPAGLAGRWCQFENYAIAVFGQPGDGTWAMRLEGHHLSVNLAFVRVGAHWQVHATPLFVGSFPVIVPPPIGGADLGDQLTWQQGQSLGLGLIRAIRRFWLAVPEPRRVAARRVSETFPQRPPLANQTPAATMLTALAINPDIRLIDQGPHLTLAGAKLSAEQRRHLASLYEELLSILHPAVVMAYRNRLEGALQTGRINATWAGGDLDDAGSQHFTSIAVGPFLIELLQTPQYSVSTPQIPWSNHLHVMLRDVASPLWGDPLGDHLAGDHAAPKR